MALFDLPLEELETYAPEIREPADFDAFWDATLAEARRCEGEPTLMPWDGPSRAIEVRDVTFPGFNGESIRAWLSKPRGEEGPLPCVVQILGYGGGRGLPIERLEWPNAGYVHLLMDTRGQGSTGGTGGQTPDPWGSEPQIPGVMTKGIQSKDTYYYRRFFTDGVRAVDFAASLPEVDDSRIAVMGGSQGGAGALAVGALSDKISAVLSDVPFLCHFDRATTLTNNAPYSELVAYLRTHRGAEDRVFETLSYFDCVNFAKRIDKPAIVSVGLMDMTCPPSTVYAAINHMPKRPDIEVYKFNGHEGGEAVQRRRQIDWLDRQFG